MIIEIGNKLTKKLEKMADDQNIDIDTLITCLLSDALLKPTQQDTVNVVKNTDKIKLPKSLKFVYTDGGRIVLANKSDQ